MNAKSEKQYRIHFMKRENGSLDDVVETGSAKSKAAATRYAKLIAKERDWRFLEVEEVTP